jgi:glycosyltransferase involved in cell wall biosynthesis
MIAHFGSHLGGGANIAGMRLHNALLRNGLESCFYYGAGEPANSSYVPLFQNRSFFWRNAAAMAVSWRNRRTVPGGFVPSPRWIRKTPIQAIGKLPSVVNLHWVARWLDLPSFLSSLPPGLPVIWTLHDLIPITGGCHYPGDCDGFTKECGNCPQLKKPRPSDVTNKFFHLKERLYQRANLHVVGNSEWTTAQAQRSGLAKYAKSIRTIHLGLDVEEFKPVDKGIARKALGIPDGRFVIGFSCFDFNERRKGAEILMEALKAFPPQEIILLVLGAGKWPASGVETIPMGSLSSPRLQSLFYSSLDVFAMPSRMETFGNTAMEAMACETPVVAYATSGLLDVVADGETGLLERDIGSVSGLARMLQWMREHLVERRKMGVAGRQRVIRQFTDTIMADRYAKFYEELPNHQPG